MRDARPLRWRDILSRLTVVRGPALISGQKGHVSFDRQNVNRDGESTPLLGTCRRLRTLGS